MTTDQTPLSLLQTLGAGEPWAGEILSEVRTESILPFHQELGGEPRPGRPTATTALAAIVAVTATLPWQRAAALQDWLTDRGDGPQETNEAAFAAFVAETLFAGTEHAGTARYLGTFIVTGRAQRTVRMLIGLSAPLAVERYAAAWARALAETKAAKPDVYARLRSFLLLLLEGAPVTVERMALLSSMGDLIGHSIATGPAAA